MGILNVTPDSFSDGGAWFSPEQAVRRALQMAEEGADFIDIGGQSTRPGACVLSDKEEQRRLLPVLEALVGKLSVPLSVDTFYPSVAAEALRYGVSVLNDVTGFENPAMVKTAAESDCGCIVMRSGRFSAPAGIRAGFRAAAGRLEAAGISPERLCFDPGIGFGTDTEACLAILRETEHIRLPGYAYLVGASRKRFIGEAGGESRPSFRVAGTLAAHTVAQLGGADILRVHDVAEAVQAARLTDALRFGTKSEDNSL